MNVSVCIPTLNRYQMLNDLIASLQHGSLKPNEIWIIDNGLSYFHNVSADFVDEYGIRHIYRKYGQNIGCAASWNKFIQMTSDIRIITNDDILFEPNSLQLMVDAFGEDVLTCPENITGGNAFSCFCLPQKIVDRVGLFDEGISPNYCFYEDCDFSLRLTAAGFSIKAVENCRVGHPISSTVKAYTPQQLDEHHQKFELARSNYVKKHGGMPGQETR